MSRLGQIESGPCSQRLIDLVGRHLPADVSVERSFDVGDASDPFAVASALFRLHEGAFVNVTVQPSTTPFWIEGVALEREYELSTTPGGSQLVLLDVPKSFRQAVMRRPTGSLVNVTVSSARGIGPSLSLTELTEFIVRLDSDAVEAVFDAGSGTTP